MYRFTLELDTVAFVDGDSWIVQCLNHNICGQGATKEEAQKAFEETFLGQMFVAPFQELQPPTLPAEYRKFPVTKSYIKFEARFGWEII